MIFTGNISPEVITITTGDFLFIYGSPRTGMSLWSSWHHYSSYLQNEARRLNQVILLDCGGDVVELL